MQNWLASPDLARGRGELSGRMSREQAEAHQRMASLPRMVHLQVRKSAEEIALERGRRSAQTKRVSGRFAKGEAIVLEGSLPKGAKR